MKHHNLKIRNGFYSAKLNGNKLFEIRENDRDFKVGDTVSYTSINGNLYDGIWKITYVTDFQQKPNYVVFGEKRVI